MTAATPDSVAVSVRFRCILRSCIPFHSLRSALRGRFAFRCLPTCMRCMGPPRCQTALPVRSRGDPWHRAQGPRAFSQFSFPPILVVGVASPGPHRPISIRPAPTPSHCVLRSASLASAASRSERCVVIRPWGHLPPLYSRFIFPLPTPLFLDGPGPTREQSCGGGGRSVYPWRP